MVRFNIYLIKIDLVLLKSVAMCYSYFQFLYSINTVKFTKRGRKGRGWNEIFQIWHLWWSLKVRRYGEMKSHRRLRFIFLLYYICITYFSITHQNISTIKWSYLWDKKRKKYNTTSKSLIVIMMTLCCV